MKVEEIQNILDGLPDQDPASLIGWLITQLVYTTTILEEIEEERKDHAS